MKIHKLFICLLIAFSFLMITACGGGGGDSTGSGEVTMSIADAKPLLPEGAENITNLWVKFTDVLVHKSGGGWNSLPLTEYPYTVDLIKLVDGVTMEIVPPVELEYGKYTQIRLVIESATIRFDTDPATEFPVEIPSGHLKTDKNFTFDPQDPADIIIDFDLSQSLVVTDPFGIPSYKLKPVLHIVKASEVATITGAITDQSFINFGTTAANITVLTNGEVYTEVAVDRDESNDVDFTLFWLEPNQDYTVEIDMDPNNNPGTDKEIDVPWANFVDGEADLGLINISNPNPPSF